MAENILTLRDGSVALLRGRGILGGILVGERHQAPMSWNQNGNWRWDGAEHPKDIVSGLPAQLPRNVG